MDVVATRLNAIAICDLPLGLTKQQAVEARGVAGSANTSSARVVLTYPHVEIEDTTGAAETRLDPLSSRLAGLIIATDLSQGWHHSPSNREIKGVVGTEVDINFYPSDYQNDTNFLNEAGIVTCMRSFATGYRAFGNRSAAFPTSAHVENSSMPAHPGHDPRGHHLLHDELCRSLGSPASVEAAEEG